MAINDAVRVRRAQVGVRWRRRRHAWESSRARRSRSGWSCCGTGMCASSSTVSISCPSGIRRWRPAGSGLGCSCGRAGHLPVLVGPSRPLAVGRVWSRLDLLGPRGGKTGQTSLPVFRHSPPVSERRWHFLLWLVALSFRELRGFPRLCTVTHSPLERANILVVERQARVLEIGSQMICIDGGI